MADMATAVFAIPELLEHILLYVYENVKSESLQLRGWMRAAGDYDEVGGHGYRQAMKRLFTLQTVSKSFKHTITRSPELRRCMGVQFDQRCRIPGHPSLGDRATLLASILPGVTLRNINSDDELPTISFDLARKTRNESRQVRFRNQQSWRDIQIPRLNALIQVEVQVQCTDSMAGREFSYTEQKRLHQSAYTLGGIADLFNKIRRRSLLRHWLRAADREGICTAVLARTAVIGWIGVLGLIAWCVYRQVTTGPAEGRGDG